MDFQGNGHQLFSSGNDLLTECMFGWGLHHKIQARK